MDARAGGIRRGQRRLHRVERSAIDQRADQGIAVERVAHRHSGIDLVQPRDEIVGDVAVDDQPAERGAALARRAHRPERDRAQREVEIGRGRDDRGVVAAQFQDAAAEAGGDGAPHLAAHPGRAGCRHHRHVRMLGQPLAQFASTDQQLRQAMGRIVAEVRGDLLEQGLDGECGQRSLSDGFQISESPHTSASAAFQLHTATGKLNAEMMPTGPAGCHCSASRWSARSDGMVRP